MVEGLSVPRRQSPGIAPMPREAPVTIATFEDGFSWRIDVSSSLRTLLVGKHPWDHFDI
jgi:hypothetical protein